MPVSASASCTSYEGGDVVVVWSKRTTARRVGDGARGKDENKLGWGSWDPGPGIAEQYRICTNNEWPEAEIQISGNR